MRKLRVIVIGGGIGGLSSAIALGDAGHEVHVYERAPELTTIGAGICLWPNGANTLAPLGLEDAIAAVSPELKLLRYRDEQGTVLREISLSDLDRNTGQRSYPIARADLQAAMLERASPSGVHLDKECVAASQERGSIAVSFADGTSAEGDLLIGADGVRSVVRRAVIGDDGTMPYYYTSWIGLVPHDLDLQEPSTFTFHVADRRRVGMLDVGQNRLYFFCDAPLPEGSPPGADLRAELREVFVGWCDTVQRLIDAIDEASTPRLAIHDLEPLERFVRGRIVLLGDAAHATTPALGQGAAMSLEDTLVLARHLDGEPTLDRALLRYDVERRARTAPMVLAARARITGMLGIEGENESDWWAALRDHARRDFVEVQEEIARTSPLLEATDEAAQPARRQERQGLEGTVA